jgi:nitroimidazol reductase NimA-like FMN-containing flavoprotein (pyridoxamine 5'-phosphate oxidase superfamily)
MRRSDKEITDRAVIDEIVRGSEVCHLAMAVGDEPYIVPISFGYDGAAVYLHTANRGKKIDMMTTNPRVCVQFERNVRLVTDDDDACAWTFSFESAIGHGAVTELVGENDKNHGLNQILRHYSGRDWVYQEPSLDSARLWRVDLETLTGKKSEHKG